MSLQVDETSKLSKALKLHEGILEYIIALNPHDFKRLRNPLMRRLMPPRITLARIATMTDTEIGELIGRVHQIAGLAFSEDDLQELRERCGELSLPLSAEQRPHWSTVEPTIVIDLLESDERLDADPMLPINRAVHKYRNGELILVKHKWEPQPLYDVWTKIGVEYYSNKKSDNEVWVYIRRLPKDQSS